MDKEILLTKLNRLKKVYEFFNRPFATNVDFTIIFNFNDYSENGLEIKQHYHATRPGKTKISFEEFASGEEFKINKFLSNISNFIRKCVNAKIVEKYEGEYFRNLGFDFLLNPEVLTDDETDVKDILE